MNVFRASILAAALVSPVVLAAPAAAQVDDTIVLDILRQCARIDDATARLACYDNNIRSAAGQTRSSLPGRMTPPVTRGPAPLAGAAPAATGSAPVGGVAGFGRESIRGPERFETPAGEIDELNVRVASVSQRQRGIYVMTLEDGARWEFAESVDFSYRPPREGSQVNIQRGALGGFLMRFDSQPTVRVRRLE